MKSVKPIISANLAGGLFSSEMPHTSKRVGTPSPTCHMYRDRRVNRAELLFAPPVLVLLLAVPCDCWRIRVARSFRAARSLVLSSNETFLRTIFGPLPLGPDPVTSENKRRFTCEMAKRRLKSNDDDDNMVSENGERNVATLCDRQT
jgi:hypothetical protein